MSKYGPRPKSTDLRILHGDRKDRISSNVPQSPPASPEPPANLSGPAEDIWRKVAPGLIEAGILRQIDEIGFGLLCQQLALFHEITDEIDRLGFLNQTKHGLKANPAVAMARQIATQCISLMGEYGMTPSSRRLLSVETVETEEFDALDEFLMRN